VWARMSPEEACLLAAAYICPLEMPKDILKADLHSLLPFVPPREPRAWPRADLPCATPSNTQGKWTFAEDDNLATHLIRNCLGRGDTALTNVLLSARGGLVRQMRDDTSAV
jgi:hypothetical protein